MARSNSYVKLRHEDHFTVKIKDPEIVAKLSYYGKRKNLNMQEVIKKLILTKDNIDGLIEDLEREKYELLDEDQKIDKILELENKLKEAGINA